MKKIAIALTLLAAPALAAASPQIAVRQTPAHVPTIAVSGRSVLRTRIVGNKFRVAYVLPTQATLVSIHKPHIRVTVEIGQSTALALRSGEIVRLKIVPVRGRP